MSRPFTTLNDEQLIKLEGLASTLTLSQIGEYFGFGITAFHELRKRQPEINAIYKKGRQKIISDVGNSLIKKALDGDSTAQMFFLKTQGRWKESAITIKKAQLDKLDNKERLELIIDSIIDSPDGEIDTKVLSTLDRLIKTKTDIDEVAEIKARLDKLENA